jgi:prophage regulatory protein
VNPNPSITGRLLRLPDALRLTGLGRTAFLDRVRSGEIPAPVKLTERASAWRECDLQRWIDSRPTAARRAA